MGGRPRVAALIAVVVATMLAGPFAASPLAAQIAVPLPGSDKPKIVHKKRPFRPTMPERNPDRVAASISAAVAPSETSKADVDASVAAGTSSSATATTKIIAASTAGPVMAATSVDDSDTEPASTPDDASSDAADAAETADASASDEPASQAPAEATEPADTEQPDTAKDVSPPDETASATADPEDVEEASGEEETEQPAETVETADAEPTAPAESTEPSEPSETTETADTNESPAGETAPADVEPTEAADTEAAETEESADAPVETAEAPAEEASPEKSATEDAGPAEPVDTGAIDTGNAEQPTETVETDDAPSYDASVVLEVSPPPDDLGAERATPSPDEAPASDTKPVETAELTPPSAPEPAPTVPSDTASESAADPEAATETPSSDGDQDSVSAPEATPSDEEEPVAAEPVQPPAHPIVAEVRARLADPDSRKGASAADLAALQAFYGERQGPPLWVTDSGFSDEAQAVIHEIGKADDWGLDATKFDLPPAADLLATPNALADDELQLSIAVLKYARYAQAGRLTPQQASPLFDQKPPLRDPKTVLPEIAEASAPETYLTSLHPQHQQFKRLREALLKARSTVEASGRDPRDDRQVQLIVMNMERWRWLPRSLGALHVWNNIPEFNTRVVKNGKIIYVEKTIVGQFKYATPFFSAPMRNIVFHPDWTVPPTIVKEDLAPKLQSGGGFFGNANTQVLRRHGLKVNLGGEPVDPDSVDWANVNIRRYTFTQDPGPANVLGKLKFNFPNSHAIYMHDTVQPELFSETVRTLSHGCIRVRDPDRFAALLLAEDKGWSPGQIDRLLAQNETSVVALNRLVPVHLTYFTAVVDESGRLNEFGDIYGIDNRMAAKLFKYPARFPVPSTPAIAEASAPERNRQTGGGFDSLISGLFGN